MVVVIMVTTITITPKLVGPCCRSGAEAAAAAAAVVVIGQSGRRCVENVQRDAPDGAGENSGNSRNSCLLLLFTVVVPLVHQVVAARGRRAGVVLQQMLLLLLLLWTVFDKFIIIIRVGRCCDRHCSLSNGRGKQSTGGGGGGQSAQGAQRK